MDTTAKHHETCRTCGRQFNQNETVRITVRGLECKDSQNCLMRFLRKKGIDLPGRAYKFAWEA